MGVSPDKVWAGTSLKEGGSLGGGAVSESLAGAKYSAWAERVRDQLIQWRKASELDN